MILGRNSISTNRDQQYFRPGHVPSYSQASHIHELVKGYTPKTNSKPQQRVSPRYVHPRVHQYRSRPLTILALPITISHWLFLPFQPITSDRIDALFQRVFPGWVRLRDTKRWSMSDVAVAVWSDWLKDMLSGLHVFAEPKKGVRLRGSDC